MMDYKEAVDYIHSIPKFRRPLGNANLSKLLECFDSPQKKLRFVHIAGTNGKGSTAAMIAEVLKHAGFKTGLFTSPFIEIFNERIKINGEMISDGELAQYTEKVKNFINANPVSEFAFITALAFVYFYEKKCDIVVIETGMGGRLDATNVIDDSLVSVITSIGYDHTQYLGETIEEIAAEKCGIIKKNGTVVSYNKGHVMDIIRDECKEQNASLIIPEQAVWNNGSILYKNERYELSLKGTFQKDNAAAAIETVKVLCKKGFNISKDNIKSGLSHTEWPVRFEFVRDNIVIDGGHNIDGIRALVKSLEETKRPVTVVMAMMKDKNCDICVREISKISKNFIATQIDLDRCLEAEELAAMSENAVCVKNPFKALERAVDLCGRDGLVCVCGSLFLAGEIRKVLKN